MNGLEEVLGAQLQLHVLGNAVIDHDRAQKRGLSLHILGKLKLGIGVIVNQSDRIGHRTSMAQR